MNIMSNLYGSPPGGLICYGVILELSHLGTFKYSALRFIFVAPSIVFLYTDNCSFEPLQPFQTNTAFAVATWSSERYETCSSICYEPKHVNKIWHRLSRMYLSDMVWLVYWFACRHTGIGVPNLHNTLCNSSCSTLFLHCLIGWISTMFLDVFGEPV